jgi:hypothetical protein
MCQQTSQVISLHVEAAPTTASQHSWLRVNTWVRVKSIREIEHLLDAVGKTEGLLFMAEMEQFCGRTLRVQSLADRVCNAGFRRLDRVCYLQDCRCSGEAHCCCQAACLLFWHEAWLEPADGPDLDQKYGAIPYLCLPICTELKAQTCTCQMTELQAIGTEMPKPGALHYLQRWLSGRLSCFQMRYLIRWALDAALLSAYKRLSPSPKNNNGPRSEFHAGDMVRVRSRIEILRTINRKGRHNGLAVTPDMLRYCGKTFRIASRVTRIIDAESRKLKILRNECYVLAGVVCAGGRLGCTREQLYYWRGVWLERVQE